jgi:hypothetical protein
MQGRLQLAASLNCGFMQNYVFAADLRCTLLHHVLKSSCAFESLRTNVRYPLKLQRLKPEKNKPEYAPGFIAVDKK